MRIEEKDDKKLIVGFRGKLDLEKNLKTYNDQLVKGEEYVKESCKDEIKALERAQHKLEKKLKKVMNSDTMKQIETELETSGDHVSVSMKKMSREVRKMQDDILRLEDESDRNDQIVALNKAVSKEYKNLVDSYPAAMRAHMLENLSNVRFLM